MSTAIETDFLPAAMAIEQRPASPLGRLVIWVIVVLFVSALAWASWGHIDIVAVASGRIIPTGHSKRVQPLERGTVAALLVTEGQSVRAGDLLVQLDDREASADAARLDVALEAVERERLRADLLARWVSGDGEPVEPGPAAADGVLRAQWRSYRQQLDVNAVEQRRKTAELDSAQQLVAKLEALLPIATRMASDRKGLSAQKLLSEQQYLEAERERLEVAHDLAAQRALVEELRAGVAELRARDKLQRTEFYREVLEQLEDARERARDLGQQRAKAEARLQATSLHAPVDGRVEQLALHGIGEVVTPAQALMTIVPVGQALEIEATLQNRDIGFVELGQPVSIKLDAFPFTRHGTVAGEIVDIASDASADERGGLVYRMRVAMAEASMMTENGEVALQPGMSVVAEVKTGSRRLIEYFLSPLLRYADESARER